MNEQREVSPFIILANLPEDQGYILGHEDGTLSIATESEYRKGCALCFTTGGYPYYPLPQQYSRLLHVIPVPPPCKSVKLDLSETVHELTRRQVGHWEIYCAFVPEWPGWFVNTDLPIHLAP